MRFSTLDTAFIASLSSERTTGVPTSVQFVIVGGGGAGGDSDGSTYGGGGGGGGGFLYSGELGEHTANLGSGYTWTARVGGGGNGSSGSDSFIDVFIEGQYDFQWGGANAKGGGYGEGTDGGNGGGGRGYIGESGGSATTTGGNSGGAGSPSVAMAGGGGGGGAGTAGDDAGYSDDGANAGIGAATDFTEFGSWGDGGYFSGGGGGGGGEYGGNGYGSADSTNCCGGGGDGGDNTGLVANSGGGGGGGDHYGIDGQNGADGIVMIRYANTFDAPSTLTGSPTVVSDDDGYRVYIWTSDGTFGWA